MVRPRLDPSRWRSVVCAALTSRFPRVGTTASPGAPRLIVRSHPTMGAEVRVTIWTPDEAAAGLGVAAVFAEFDRLDALLSVWKPGSDVLRINAAAGQAPVAVSRETIEVVQRRSDDQRADGGEVRHHVRRARRRLEVRSRSGQPRPDSRPRSRRGCRSSISARCDVDERAGRWSIARPACACTSAASARATPSIAACASCAAAGSTTS